MASIVLIGPRCVGKTEVGKVLVEELGMPLVDADQRFTERYGNITNFVDTYGWPEFRKAESEILEEICFMYRRDRIVLTPGGGAVAHDQGEFYREKNERVLRQFGQVIYLLPSLDLEESARVLLSRESSDPNSASNRPSLGNVKDLLEKRHPLYKQAAHIVVVTGTKSVAEIANELLPLFRPVLSSYIS